MSLVCQKCGHSSNWDTAQIHIPRASALPSPDGFAAPSHRTALAEIKVEIARFKTYSEHYISALVKRQEEIEAKLRTIVYPVLSLPTEITSRIFVECLPDNCIPSARHAPLLLTRVCRQWKAIALSTCELWSSLHIESLSYDKLMVPRGTSFALQTWFSRAGERLLSLTIECSRREVQEQALEQLDISSILHRLLRLDLPPLERAYRGVIPLHISLPQLQFLDAAFTAADLKDVLAHTPLLAELQWSRYSPETLDFRSLTSNTLTVFCVYADYAFSTDEFITILRNFPSLSELACTVSPEANYRNSPLTFPNLSSLGLFRDYDSDVSVIQTLELLTLPNLSSFRCFSSLNPDVTVPFLARSACVIRTLACDFYKDTTNISQHLQIFSSVETLDFHIVDIGNCLRALDPRSSGANPSSPILPKLRHVTITCQRRMVSADYSSIVDVVRGRLTHPDTAELKSFHTHIENFADGNLDACPNCPSDVVAAELRSFAVGGLDLKLDSVFPRRTEDEDET
ncbi:hypothetical protein C8R45DRAFT_117542 [Mycena sanguinolenta]|nr:hypothetical protein C8R45DRAFT_117542 [Mycena sanguinolenta]